MDANLDIETHTCKQQESGGAKQARPCFLALSLVGVGPGRQLRPVRSY